MKESTIERERYFDGVNHQVCMYAKTLIIQEDITKKTMNIQKKGKRERNVWKS